MGNKRSVERKIEAKTPMENERSFEERILQTFPETLCDIQWTSPEEFKSICHNGNPRPSSGATICMGYFEHTKTGEIWLGKSNPVYETNIQDIILEIIARDIYAFFGVPVPRCTISRLDIKDEMLKGYPQSFWSDELRNINIKQTDFLMSRWLGRFHPYDYIPQFNPKDEDFFLKVKDQYVCERGLGKILAIALWINDIDVIGPEGGNIGYRLVSKNDTVIAESCKIDSEFSFTGFGEDKVKQIQNTIQLRAMVLESEKKKQIITWKELPVKTREEFLITIHQILQVPKKIIEIFFVRKGTERLEKKKIDNFVNILENRQKSMKYQFDGDIENCLQLARKSWLQSNMNSENEVLVELENLKTPMENEHSVEGV